MSEKKQKLWGRKECKSRTLACDFQVFLVA